MKTINLFWPPSHSGLAMTVSNDLGLALEEAQEPLPEPADLGRIVDAQAPHVRVGAFAVFDLVLAEAVAPDLAELVEGGHGVVPGLVPLIRI
jgi:hypothetical protein